MEPSILAERAGLLVCVKPRGILSQPDGRAGLPDLLGRERPFSFLQPVTRLDREAGGLIALAASPEAAAALQKSLQAGAWEKEYLAVLRGAPAEPEGELRDWLYHDARKNRTFVVKSQRRGVREAVLRYRVLAPQGELTLVRVTLLTGRTHQIRAQFSARGLPLCGDGRYSGGGGPLGLWCARLALPEPGSGARLCFECPPPLEAPFDAFPQFAR